MLASALSTKCSVPSLLKKFRGSISKKDQKPALDWNRFYIANPDKYQIKHFSKSKD